MPITMHPQRADIDNELHSRPPLEVTAPGVVQLLTYTAKPGEALTADPVAALFTALGKDPEVGGSRQIIQQLDGGTLKWERHGEFETFTLAEPRDPKPNGVPLRERSALWTQIMDVLAEHHPGQCIVAARVAIFGVEEGNPTVFDPSPYFSDHELRGAEVLGGFGAIWTDFRIGEDGYTQYVAVVKDMPPPRIGRFVQRILEIETYRFMAMLGFPVARDAQVGLSRIEGELQSIAGAFRKDQNTNDADISLERQQLDRIQSMAMEASRVSENTSFRLSATAAYAQIVDSRFEELRERRIEGISRPSAFLGRRMGPAITTCATVKRRQEDVARRIADASNLLRTRVDIAMETQNQSILTTIQNTSRTQVRLQKAVEGLSVVAVSYYLISILNVFWKGAEKAGIWSSWELIAAGVAPFAIILVLYMARRATRGE